MLSDLTIFQRDRIWMVTKTKSSTMTPVLAKLGTCDDHALSPDTINGGWSPLGNCFHSAYLGGIDVYVGQLMLLNIFRGCPYIPCF